MSSPFHAMVACSPVLHVSQPHTQPVYSGPELPVYQPHTHHLSGNIFSCYCSALSREDSRGSPWCTCWLLCHDCEDVLPWRANRQMLSKDDSLPKWRHACMLSGCQRIMSRVFLYWLSQTQRNPEEPKACLLG